MHYQKTLEHDRSGAPPRPVAPRVSSDRRTATAPQRHLSLRERIGLRLGMALIIWGRRSNGRPRIADDPIRLREAQHALREREARMQYLAWSQHSRMN